MPTSNSPKNQTHLKEPNSPSRANPWLIGIAILVIAVAGVVSHIDSLISMGLVNLANYELLKYTKEGRLRLDGLLAFMKLWIQPLFYESSARRKSEIKVPILENESSDSNN